MKINLKKKNFQDLLCIKKRHFSLSIKNFKKNIFIQIAKIHLIIFSSLFLQVNLTADQLLSAISIGASVEPVVVPKPAVPLLDQAKINPSIILKSDSIDQTVNFVAPEQAAKILDFWFGTLPHPEYFPEEKLKLWLANTSEVSDLISQNFLQDILNASRGDYNQWRQTPRGRLALILLLDQFPRQLYRNKSQQFSFDSMARALVLEGMQKGDDRQLYPIERAFFYLPLQHSEELQTQDLSVDSYRRLLADSPSDLKPQMIDFLHHAVLHQQQIARFGRFPHRNAILGRKSSQQELIFLNQ